MKRLFIHCLSLVSFFSINAQLPKLGIKGKHSESELLSTDLKFSNTNRYYHAIPFTLKAGEAVVFYMQSNSFTPLVTLISTDRKYFGTFKALETKNGKEARVAFIAQRELYPDSKIFSPHDTSFQVVFTSNEENITGKYSFGYKLIDSSQMIYHESSSFCARLYYLINQWAADWDLIPESMFNPVPHPGKITKFVLVPDIYGSSLYTGTGAIGPSIMDDKASYSEIMYSSSTDRGQDFFVKMVKDIKECLGETNWVFETETKDDDEAKREIQYFYLKGGAKDQPHQSFKVIWSRPFEINALYKYEVQLIFN